METEILVMIKSYLGDDYPEDQEGAITVLVDTNVSEFKANMNYPSSFTDEEIEDDLLKNKACIFWCVIYDLTMMGVEFQSSNAESGSTRSWRSKSEVYARHGVVPYAGT